MAGGPSRLDLAAYCAARHPRVAVMPPVNPICGSGWDVIVTKAVDRIAGIVGWRPGARVEIERIDEKYGTLRIDFSAFGMTRRQRRLVEAAVSLAEERSACTCETCGALGRVRFSGMSYEASCDEHAGRGAGDPEPLEFSRSRRISRHVWVRETVAYERDADKLVVLKRRRVPNFVDEDETRRATGKGPDMHIETSFGPLAIDSTPLAELEKDSRFDMESDPFTREASLGQAQFVLRFTMGEEGPHTYVTVTSGIPVFPSENAITPGFKRDGYRLGYISHVTIDAASNSRAPWADPRTIVRDLDGPVRLLGIAGTSHDAPDIRIEVSRVVAAAVDAFLAENPGIVTRFEAACLAVAQRRLDEEIKREWRELSAKTSLRDRCRGRMTDILQSMEGAADDMVEIRMLGDSQATAELWAYDKASLPASASWDEAVATGIGMAHVQLLSDRQASIDIDLLDGRTMTLSVTGEALSLSGKVDAPDEALRLAERAGIALDPLAQPAGDEE